MLLAYLLFMCVVQLATYNSSLGSQYHRYEQSFDCFKASTNATLVKCWLSNFDSSWCETNVSLIIIAIDSLEATKYHISKKLC